MFYNGDLQSGIALAMREVKCLVCFVADGSEASLLWEQYLEDDEISELLHDKAITLRLVSSSREADYLAAFYPFRAVPLILAIKKGVVCLDLHAGSSEGEIKGSLRALFNDESQSMSQRSHDQSFDRSVSELRTASSKPMATSLEPTDNDNPIATSSSRMQEQTQAAQPPTTVRNMYEDRRRRLELDKKTKEAAEKAERLAQAHTRQQALTAAPDSAKAKQTAYAQEQRKRKQAATLERERILKEIENDKAVRREKEESRRALAKAEKEDNGGAGGLVNKQLSNETAPLPRSPHECALQVRLLDGSTIRSRFPSDQSLRQNVRHWVDENRSENDTPYTFKQILVPLPNRAITITEEEESLQSLGLLPSATLIMVPVQRFTAAYSEQHGIVAKGLSASYNIFSTGAEIVTGALSTFFGIGQGTAAVRSTSDHGRAPENIESAARQSRGGTDIHTLENQEGERDRRQLYNGNQLNFEPRRDEDEKKE